MIECVGIRAKHHDWVVLEDLALRSSAVVFLDVAHLTEKEKEMSFGDSCEIHAAVKSVCEAMQYSMST